MLPKRLLDITYKDLVTNEDVRRKIQLQAAIREYYDLRTMVEKTETEVGLANFKIFWFSEASSAGHIEIKKEKRQTEEEVGRQYVYLKMDRDGIC